MSYSEHSDQRSNTIAPAGEPTEFDWMALGNCLGLDSSLFFPDNGETGAEAIAVCAGCPVRLDCLDYALDHNERYGVWGGLTTSQRARVRRNRREGRPVASLLAPLTNTVPEWQPAAIDLDVARRRRAAAVR